MPRKKKVITEETEKSILETILKKDLPCPTCVEKEGTWCRAYDTFTYNACQICSKCRNT